MSSKKNPPWWVFALVVFLCLVGAFAACMSVVKFTEGYAQPVPGISPSAANR